MPKMLSSYGPPEAGDLRHHHHHLRTALSGVSCSSIANNTVIQTFLMSEMIPKKHVLKRASNETWKLLFAPLPEAFKRISYNQVVTNIRMKCSLLIMGSSTAGHLHMVKNASSLSILHKKYGYVGQNGDLHMNYWLQNPWETQPCTHWQYLSKLEMEQNCSQNPHTNCGQKEA